MRNNPYLGWHPFPNVVIPARYDYSTVLRQLGQNPIEGRLWAFVRETERVQGWKLHLSSVNVEGTSLLETVVPHLQRTQTPFKVARDSRILSHLNDGMLGMPQVGKFMTIYPETDEAALGLADWLVENTRCFSGPVILTDAHLGGIVYARYGSFRPRIAHDRLGRSFRGIFSPEGKLVSDNYQIPFAPQSGIPFPFEPIASSKTPEGHMARGGGAGSTKSKLIGGRYILIEVLNKRPRGSTFLAIDLLSPGSPSLKVIKEGKPYCQSDDHGRDVRDRLRHQQRVHVALEDKVRVPVADSYFEEEGRGYLALQYIDWEDVRSLAENPWCTLSWEKKLDALRIVADLIEQAYAMHKLGYVHRDLSPSNIFLFEGKVYLTDFDLAYSLADAHPPFQGGTPGFASPQQFAGERPDFTDDVYAIGCEMIYLLLGVHPRLIVTEEREERGAKLLDLFAGTREIADLVNRCIDADSRSRPALTEAADVIQDVMTKLSVGAPVVFDLPTGEMNSKATNQIIEEATEGVLKRAVTDERGLWVSSLVEEYPPGEEPFLIGHHELRRSTYSGVAGAVYTLALLRKHGCVTPAIDPTLRERVASALEWLEHGSASDSDLRGLYFGESGVAVTFAEAIASGLRKRDQRVETFIRDRLSSEPDWPDLTHGAAGQGIAAFLVSDRLCDPSISAVSHKLAAYLIDCQREDGAWQMPPGADGVSGRIYSGFAHGASGIAYFLAEYDRRYQHPQAQQAWRKAVRWLTDTAQTSEEGLLWSINNVDDRKWKFWCHGSIGIALLFLRLFEQTGDPSHRRVAEACLQSSPRNIPLMNLSLCHGVAGIGEVYLEAYRVLGGTEWRERAMQIRGQLVNVASKMSDGMIWLVEDSLTADLMIGSSGIVHFLMKASFNDQVGFPLLLDPLRTHG